MTNTLQLYPQFYVTLNGADAPVEIMNAIEEISVESSLHLPSVATLVLHDPHLAMVDHANFAPLTAITISVKIGQQPVKIFDGEIIELEPIFSAQSQQLLVRAFDRLHKLSRGHYSRTFLNVTDSDLVSKLAGEAGLSAQATSTSEVYTHCFQVNQSNLEYLRQRLARIGHLLTVDGTTLKSGPPASSATVTLAWGSDLTLFRPRMSVSGYTNKVTVRSWDLKTKKAIVGTATNGDDVVPKLGVTSSKPSLSNINLLLSDCRVPSQAEADKLAQAHFQHRSSQFIEAEGAALGNPKIKAGVTVDISGLGTRFSGTYIVTSATHRYLANEGYTTEFAVSGMNPGIIQGLLDDTPPPAALGAGVMIGVVTNNQDPDKLGRVKVKLPWLSEEDESEWARVASPGVGDNRGIMFLPEVNDEVLVAFEQGDINRPYVVGGLWNGKDASPYADGVTVKNGVVAQRTIVSRTGHKITIDDTDDNGGITITDKNGNKIVLKAQDNSLTVTTQGDISVTSQKNISFTATSNITLKATGNLNLEATGDVSIKATKNLTAEGMMQAQFKGTAGTTIESPAITEVKGSLIKLN